MSFSKKVNLVNIIHTQKRFAWTPPRFHIIPGGTQNANDTRNIRLNWLAFWNRVKLHGKGRYTIRGLIETFKDQNQSHEINFGETLGTLRGVDEFGNRYFENLDNQKGRDRWVNYAERRREGSHATTVPPGWWGWLHHSRVTTPADPEYPKPPNWVLLHKENFTGTDKRYLPHNYGGNVSSVWKNLRYKKWDPNETIKNIKESYDNEDQNPKISQ